MWKLEKVQGLEEMDTDDEDIVQLNDAEQQDEGTNKWTIGRGMFTVNDQK